MREAIDSVYSQTYKNWEIIFWDNASTDNSVVIATSYDEKLRYFRSKETVSLGKARNWAIEKSEGEYVSFLDCDDRWLPQKLEKQVAFFARSPETDFIYTNYYTMLSKNGRKYIGLKGKQPEGKSFGKFLLYYPINLQTVIFRKKVIQGIDMLFDERLRLSEDYDLFMRILYTSCAGYIREPLAIYRVHSEMNSIKFIHDWPEETSYILDKFRHSYPDFDDKYSKEINYIKAKIGYREAKAAMSEKNCLEARRYLSPYKFFDLRFFSLYAATYMPLIIWNVLHSLKEKNILR